jgi:hypothetical protein
MRPMMAILFLFFSPLAFSNHTQEMEFYPYECEFDRFDNSWYFMLSETNESSTKISWNEVAAVGRSLYEYVYDDSVQGRFGLCHYVASTGAQKSFNFTLVEGKELEMPLTHACEYTGKELSYAVTRVNFDQNDQYAFNEVHLNMGSLNIEKVVILGVSSVALNTEALQTQCVEAFTKMKAEQTLLNRSQAPYKMKRVQ